jgi:hypothetical protein
VNRTKPRSRLWPSGGWVPILPLALVVFSTCRDYGLPKNDDGASDGGSGGGTGVPDSGGTGTGGAGMGGDGGEPVGGNGAVGGEAGHGMSGNAGSGGSGGEAGSMSDPEPGIFGAVRLFVEGVPQCGGTLITNSWVLTFGECVSPTTPPSAVSVGFGMDSLNLEQTRRALEIVHFPGRGQTSVPDLMLIGVDAPFSIGGSSSGHVMPLWFAGPTLLGTHRCVGWDLEPSTLSPTNRLRSAFLGTVAVDPSPVEIVWWTNSNLFDPAHGELFTEDDRGSACLRQIHDVSFVTAVHGFNPDVRHDNQPNYDEEAYSLSVAPTPVHAWIDDTLFGVLPPTEWTLAGHAAVCSFSAENLEVFGLDEDGEVRWLRQVAVDAPWIEESSIIPPEVELAPDRPGLLCNPDGSIELFVRAVDDTVWWQRRRSGSWAFAWERLEGALATSGLTAVGVGPSRFHLFARGSSGELRHSEYAGSWVREWESLGGAVVGAPSARIAHASWLDVYVQDVYGNLADLYYYFQPPNWAAVGEAPSEPATVSWTDERVDVFMRNGSGTLRRTWFPVPVGNPPPVDTQIVLPEGRLNALSRESGRFDVFVTEPGAPLWHAVWPRDPRAAPPSNQ